MPPANEPIARIGMKMPPGVPEPKLVLVKIIFAANNMHNIPMPDSAFSDNAMRFDPPPSTSGSQMPTGNAIAMATIGRIHAGNLPYNVCNPSRERFTSEPTRPATIPSGINQMYSARGSCPTAPKSNTGRSPKQYFETKSAVSEAAVAPIKIVGEKLR